MLIECHRVMSIQGPVTAEDLLPLVDGYAASQPIGPAIAEHFLSTISILCEHSGVNRKACGAAGVINSVVSALTMYGPTNPGVAWRGCRALGRLAEGKKTNADAILLPTGGVDAILSAMGKYPRVEDVQGDACNALCIIATSASPASLAPLKAGRVLGLLKAAKRAFPEKGDNTVRHFADHVLAMLKT